MVHNTYPFPLSGLIFGWKPAVMDEVLCSYCVADAHSSAVQLLFPHSHPFPTPEFWANFQRAHLETTPVWPPSTNSTVLQKNLKVPWACFLMSWNLLQIFRLFESTLQFQGFQLYDGSRLLKTGSYINRKKCARKSKLFGWKLVRIFLPLNQVTVEWRRKHGRPVDRESFQ